MPTAIPSQAFMTFSQVQADPARGETPPRPGG